MKVLSLIEKTFVEASFYLKRIMLPQRRSYSLVTSAVSGEKVPMIVNPIGRLSLRRIP
ncbi:MAG TPA: hypothetical protein PLI08_00170 [Bacteroidia bacterium]|jgi:hypothetical protein|uniref:hypothetical protein n=1 Tax=Candidatus Pollutiaquabacter sp. TaxID=3416354 RepID=UPI002CE595E5|nr:hypothetical protein [Bacteroidia bacterium]HRU60362.1 hypothetical protein [Bacteroidia bacterium]